MKSGPTLNGCTTRPRRRRAAMSPTEMDVFPTPLCVPARTNAFMRSSVEPGNGRDRRGAEDLWMDDGGEDLEPVHEPWPRPRKVRLRIRGEDATTLGRGCLRELLAIEECASVLDRVVQ